MKITLALLMAIGICHAGVLPPVRLSALNPASLGYTYTSGEVIQGGPVVADHGIVGLQTFAVPSGVTVSHVSSDVVAAPAVTHVTSGVLPAPALTGIVGPAVSGVVAGQAISGLVAPQAISYASPFFGAQLSVEAPAAEAVVDTAADSVAVEAPAEEAAAPAPEVAAEVSSAVEDALAEPAPAEEARAEEPAPVEAAPVEAAPVEAAPAEEAAPVEDAPAPAAEEAPAVVLDFNNVEAPTPVEDTPEVAEAKAAHLAAVEETKARNALAEQLAASVPVLAAPAPVASQVAFGGLVNGAIPASFAAPVPAAYAAPVPAAYAAPVPAAYPAPIAASYAGPIATSYAAPVAAHFAAPVPAPLPAPIAPAVAPVAPVVTSQYHSQDELGQYSFGYAGGPSAKEEIKTVDGITRGAYSYVDANGKVQITSYVSDPVNGFRVTASNLPVAPAAPAVPVAATYLEDTPEVAEAKANLLKLQEEHIAKLSA